MMMRISKLIQHLTHTIYIWPRESPSLCLSTFIIKLLVDSYSFLNKISEFSFLHSRYLQFLYNRYHSIHSIIQYHSYRRVKITDCEKFHSNLKLTFQFIPSRLGWFSRFQSSYFPSRYRATLANISVACVYLRFLFIPIDLTQQQFT